MKKGSLIIWIVIILGSLYTVLSISKGFDAEKIDTSLKAFLSTTTSSFYFDRVQYDTRALPSHFRAIRVGDSDFFARIVSEESERARGLSGVDRMDDNVGMLFAFETPGQHGFWMKDMNFAIDIVWIGEDMKIVDITRGLSPETYPEVVRPTAPARFVLELNSGISEKNGLKKGDAVSF